jgi:hypothetical protein
MPSVSRSRKFTSTWSISPGAGFSYRRGSLCPSDTIPSMAQRTARRLVLGVELADHGLGLIVEGGDDLVGVLFRVVKSQVADARSTTS